MINILKCILALVIELNIYQWFGCAMNHIKIIPQANTFIMKGIYGFLGYHVLFWCMAFPGTLLNGSLGPLTVLWCVLIMALLLFIGIRYFHDLLEMYQTALFSAWNNKLFLVPCLLLGAVISYYICVNGEINIDARTYIGEVTSMVDTGQLAGISVTSGMETQMIELRRSFSMFGVNSAVLCQLFQVHPLAFCRTTRAVINVIFFAGAAFEILRKVFRHQRDAISHALLCTMLTLGLLFPFANTIYTESRFLLSRAYEGKAYCATTMVLITILIVIKLWESDDKRYFVLLFLDMLAGMSISASATFILPLVGGCILLAYILCKKKWWYMLFFLLSVLPNLVYIILSISGLAGFSLEG